MCFIFIGAVAMSGYNYYSRFQVIDFMECHGNVSSILDCHYTISYRECIGGLADIVCQGNLKYYTFFITQIFCCVSVNPQKSNCIDNDVRIVGGPTPLEGTVETCRNKVWIGICSRNQNSAFANIVCYQLGYQFSGTLCHTYHH